jgi:hypothetical protein
MPRGNAQNISLGPGYLYMGPLGTPEPVDLSTAWATVSASWAALGYTVQGSEFRYTLATAPVDVAEELDPVVVATTGRTSTVTFILAEVTLTNLMRALNAPTSVINTGAGVNWLEPPDLGTEVRRMLGFESEDHTERWLWRQCFQTGQITITRQKGNANATISTEWTLEKPASGSRLFKCMMAAPQRA